jgi:hypothetical protein
MNNIHKKAANELLKLLLYDAKIPKDQEARNLTGNKFGEYGNLGVLNPLLRKSFDIKNNEIDLIWKALKKDKWINGRKNPNIPVQKIDAAVKFLSEGGYNQPVFLRWIKKSVNIWGS